MTKNKRVQKRCDKCGRASMARPRERRCKLRRDTPMGKSGYWCYGNLTRVTRARKPVDDAVKRSNRLERQRKTAKRELWNAASRLERLAKELNIVKHDEGSADRMAQLVTMMKRLTASMHGWHARLKTATAKLAAEVKPVAVSGGSRYIEVPDGDD